MCGAGVHQFSIQGLVVNAGNRTAAVDGDAIEFILDHRRYITAAVYRQMTSRRGNRAQTIRPVAERRHVLGDEAQVVPQPLWLLEKAEPRPALGQADALCCIRRASQRRAKLGQVEVDDPVARHVDQLEVAGNQVK